MSEEIGWRFPPTNGGRIDGFNDPGIAHFNGAPLASLARETIQNSLDAGLAPEEPVHVSFELINLDRDEIGRGELTRAIDASIKTAGDDSMANAALAAAKSLKRRLKTLSIDGPKGRTSTWPTCRRMNTKFALAAAADVC